MFSIRWTDFNASGADDGLAIDDVAITPHGGGAPTVTINDVSVAEGDSGTLSAAFTVTVSSAVHAGVTFDIATADGIGPQGATTADGDYLARSETGISIPAGATSSLVRRLHQRRHHRRARRDFLRPDLECIRRGARRRRGDRPSSPTTMPRRRYRPTW